MRTTVTDSFPACSIYNDHSRCQTNRSQAYLQPTSLFVQTFAIDRYFCHHQVCTICCLCQALVDTSKRVSIEPTQAIKQKYPDERFVYHFQPNLSYAID
jgi:hypothetical protein